MKDRPHSVVRYEELVRNPEQVLGSLMRQLGLSFDPRQLEWASQMRHNVGGNGMRRSHSSELKLDEKWRDEFTLLQKLAIDAGTLLGRYPSRNQCSPRRCRERHDPPAVLRPSSAMQLILVGGAQRSGTTLLQTLLANALGSPNLPEAHILSDILAAYKRAKEFGNKTSYFYPTDDSLRAFFQSFAERHVADITAGSKPGTLVLKDPNFVQVLDEAAALFPALVRIVCMRDPRDIAASFVQIGQRQTADQARQIRKARHPLHQQEDPWPRISLCCARCRPGVVMVRYEDLASDPKGALQALGRDTGLKLSLDRIEDAAWLDAPARHEAAWISELEGAKPSPASIGSFKRVLLGEEVAIVQRVCEPIMRQFAYAPTDDVEPQRGAGSGAFSAQE